MKLYRPILFSAGLIILGVAAFIIYNKVSTKESPVTIAPARIVDIRRMAELCTMEIYSEVPVKDTINNKMLVGVQKQRGRISFDLDNLNPDTHADTIRIELPPEIIRLYESTDDNSWEVIDSKNIGMFGAFRSDRLTVAEENLLKEHLRVKGIARLYTNGTVAKARKEACFNLEKFLSAIYGKPVVVVDPRPYGYPER